MSRYLFRGKRVDNGEWIEGNLLETKPKHGCQSYIVPIGYCSTNGIQAKVAKLFEVIPATVGQCTGLKDKNGKLIYFGDNLRFADKWEWYKGSYGVKMLFASEVEHKKLLEQFNAEPYEERTVKDISDYEWLLSSDIQVYWEIIGNIHSEKINEA